MNRPSRILIIFAISAAEAASRVRNPQNTANGSKPGAFADDHAGTRIFNRLTDTLMKKTRVPLRLPTFVPDGDDEAPIFASLESASAESYQVELAWKENCGGGDACHYGTVRGSAGPLIEEGRHRSAVILARGIKGYFVGFKCGAHCDDSSVGWTERGYHYAISVKAGKVKELIQMANSAITGRAAGS